MNEGMIALWLVFVSLILLAWAGVHVIYQATVGAPYNMQLVTGLCIAGGALLAAGIVLLKRQGGRGE